MTEPTETTTRPATNWKLWIGVAVILIVLGVGLRNSSATRPEIGDTAPDLEMIFFEGYEWRNQNEAFLSDMQGNIVVLNFWASWCAPCRQEAALLENTWRAYEDRGVVFVGIAWSDTESKALEYLEEYDTTYPNAPDLLLVAEDLYRFTGVPETYVLDRNGEILYFHTGPLTEPQLRSMLESALGSG